jgi:hypothetical protein
VFTPVVCDPGQECDPATGDCVALPTTAMFQEGDANGYAGTQDTFLQESSPGNVNGAMVEWEWDDDDPNGSNNANLGLLRFGNIFGSGPNQIPPGATIVSATLEYTLFDPGVNASVREALADWDESDSLTSVCGASCDEGAEYGAFELGTASGVEPLGVKSVDVTSSVQAWSIAPASNRGWFFIPPLVPGAAGGGAQVRASEYATPSLRPKLTVIYRGCIDNADCDDGNVCTDETCTDGVCSYSFNTDACDDGADCTSGDVCDNGVCVGVDICPAGTTCDLDSGLCVGPGQNYCDDFNRADLGANWVADNLSFTIVANEVSENSGANNAPGQLRWVGGATDTIDQYGKIQLTDASPEPFGFMLRVNGTPGEHYEVHLPANSTSWRWERYDPLWLETKANCSGDTSATDGDYIGVTIEGTGIDTLVSVWRWDVDPDAGGAVDIANNWGPPDCTMQGAAGPYVDTGTSLGIRAYSLTANTDTFADNWCGGDVAAATVPPCETDEDCEDFNPCTIDTCDPGIGCVFDGTGVTDPCDDNNACTENDVCQGDAAGTCAGTGIDCDDGNPCTADLCDPATGCDNDGTGITDPCDDNDACTENDVCQGDAAGTCSGPPVDCDDNDPCTEDSCNPVIGCVHDPIPGCGGPDVSILPVASLIDPAGTPETNTGGPPASVTDVIRGLPFWLEIWASDVGVENSGLTSVYVDIGFCGEATAVDVLHGSLFTTLPSGTIIPMAVDEFGGSALPSGGGIEPEWVRIGWIGMVAASDMTDCPVTLLPSMTGVGALGRGLVPWSEVELGAIALTGVPGGITYDLDGSGFIDAGDLSLWAVSWNQAVPPASELHDFDCDGFVGPGDLSWFATGWLKFVDDPTIQYSPNCTDGPLSSRAASPDTDVQLALAVVDAPSATDTTETLPASLTSVAVGETYFVEVWATDSGSVNTGLTSTYLDFAYPADRASVQSISHGGVFTLFPEGLDDGQGLIDELGGSQLTEGIGVEPEWVRVAMIEMVADATTSGAPYALAPSALGVGAYGRGLIAWPDVELDALTIPQGLSLPGDVDGDGDVDLADFAGLPGCMTGPEAGAMGTGCDVFDFDEDVDVDLEDFGQFQAVFTGSL